MANTAALTEPISAIGPTRAIHDRSVEFIAGKLVARDMVSRSSWIGGELFALLRNFCRRHGVGWVWPEGTPFRCFPDDPQTIRKSDVALIRAERYPAPEPPDGVETIVPDLVAKVISPNDLAYEVDEKVMRYLSAGVPLVWVVHPRTKTVTVYRHDGSISRLGSDDALAGEQVVPGFSCRVAELFQYPGSPKGGS